MYDPIPWHLDAAEARDRGLAQPGWYVLGDDGLPVAGPCEGPEACVTAMIDDAERRRLTPVEAPSWQTPPSGADWVRITDIMRGACANLAAVIG